MNKQSVLNIIGGFFATVLILVIIFGGMVVSTGNTSVKLNNQVLTAQANVNKEQQRRVTLFNNMVDAVKSYNQYEGSTLEKVTSTRSKDIDKAKLTLNAVAEKYPDLKSQKNYQNLTTEFSVTENRLANYIEAYNETIQSYNDYTQTFPNRTFIGISGQTVHHYQQSNYKVNNNEATSLFK